MSYSKFRAKVLVPKLGPIASKPKRPSANIKNGINYLKAKKGKKERLEPADLSTINGVIFHEELHGLRPIIDFALKNLSDEEFFIVMHRDFVNAEHKLTLQQMRALNGKSTATNQRLYSNAYHKIRKFFESDLNPYLTPLNQRPHAHKKACNILYDRTLSSPAYLELQDPKSMRLYMISSTLLDASNHGVICNFLLGPKEKRISFGRFSRRFGYDERGLRYTRMSQLLAFLERAASLEPDGDRLIDHLYKLARTKRINANPQRDCGLDCG